VNDFSKKFKSSEEIKKILSPEKSTGDYVWYLGLETVQQNQSELFFFLGCKIEPGE
jgi:hypothetical protein